MQDQVVVITGANRGLGRALVSAFIKEGATVCGISRTPESNIKLIEELSTSQFIGVTANVAKFEQVHSAFKSIVDRTGKIDVLFNNAAVYPKVNFLEESAEDWSAAILTNLGGVATCCKAVLPYMIKAKQGKIYNVGSWADLGPAPNSSAYTTSKGGLHSLTKSIAVDLEPLGLAIEVHEWLPGHLNTRMSDFTGISPSLSAQWGVELVSKIASSKNTIFEKNVEWVPPKGLRQKLKDAVMFWRN